MTNLRTSLSRKTHALIRERATDIAERHHADKSSRWLLAQLTRAFPDVGPLILRRAMRKAVRIASGEKLSHSGSPPSFCVVATPDELDFIRAEGKKVGSKAGVFHNAIRLYRGVLARPDWRARLKHAFPELEFLS